MRITVPLALALCLILPRSAAPDQKPPGTIQEAAGSVEWTKPAGAVKSMNSSGSGPGFDIVKLALISDGTALVVTATLATALSGTWADDVAELYIDTDNNPATGSKTSWSNKHGFELQAKLRACVEYEGGSACMGAVSGRKVKGYYSSMKLGNASGSVFPPFKEPKGTAQGTVVSASLAYKDLGVRAGQTIRIVAIQSGGSPDETSEFPAVLLTLK